MSNAKDYNKISATAKAFFCLTVSFILTFLVFGFKLFSEEYGLLFVSFRLLDIVSSDAFLFYFNVLLILIFQNAIYSITAWIVDIWSFDESYESTSLSIDGEKISKELFFKITMLKHIPVFSLINGIVWIIFGKSIIDFKYKLDKKKVKNILVFKVFIVILVGIFAFSFVRYSTDDEVKMLNSIEEIPTISEVDTVFLEDTSSNEYIYTLNVYLEDGYIHFNKFEYAKEQIENTLKNNVDYIKSKYAGKIGKIQGFNIVIQNNYARTWEKYMYNNDMTEKYEMSNISSDIHDIDIYVKNGSLVYNILTNFSRNDIGWDVAEFLLYEFETDIENAEIQNKLKKIVGVDENIDKYVVNILSKEYYVSNNNTFFVFIKGCDMDSWYYYDNSFFSLEKQQKKFEQEVVNIYSDVKLDFEKLYDNGEITIITKEEIDLDVLNNLLMTTKSGQDIVCQTKYLGNMSEIKFILEED